MVFHGELPVKLMTKLKNNNEITFLSNTLASKTMRLRMFNLFKFFQSGFFKW